MTQPAHPTATPVSQALLEAATSIRETHERFAARQLSSVDHAIAREAWLVKGLTALAEQHGVRLESPLFIDSGGDFMLVAQRPDVPTGPLLSRAGPFKTLADVLNRHQPRTGVAPGAIMTPESGWCCMNHFQVEAMVLEAAFGPQPAAAAAPAAAAPAAEAKRRNRP